MASRSFATLTNLALSTVLLAATLPARAQPTPLAADVFLRTQMGLSDAALSRVKAGEVVVKVLEPADSRELAVFGVVAVDVPVSVFLDAFRNITEFKRGDQVLQIGVFGSPPSVRDVKTLRIDRPDLEAIRECEVGDCDVQLSALGIERLRSQVHWSRPYYRAQAEAIIHQMMVEYVQAYLSGGNAALVEYHDHEMPVSLASEFTAILGQWPFLNRYFPELHDYLLRFPTETLPGVEDFVYWSKEQFGLKPVVSLTHACIYLPSQDRLADAVVTSKQIYASHYFDASLGITMLVNRHEQEPSIYVMYFNRSRTGTIQRHWSSLARWIVERRLRGGTRDNLRQVKERLEAAYGHLSVRN